MPHHVLGSVAIRAYLSWIRGFGYEPKSRQFDPDRAYNYTDNMTADFSDAPYRPIYTAEQLYQFLRAIPRRERMNKLILLELVRGEGHRLLEIDDADPTFLWLKNCTEPASEN